MKKGVELYAPLWRRIIAFLIDWFFIDVVVLMPFSGLLNRALPQDYSIATLSSEAALLKLSTVLSLISIIIFLYFFTFEYKLSQTPGKILLRIYAKGAGEKLTFWEALVRNLMFIPIFPLSLLIIIDPIFLIFRNYRLSEYFSRTRTLDEGYK